MTQFVSITVNSRWRSKRLGIEVRVRRATIHTVSFLVLDFTLADKLPHWQFFQNFEPVI
jgi:hypothetical protein